MKRIKTACIVTALIIGITSLTACDKNSEKENISTSQINTQAPVTTTQKVNAVENQPEDTKKPNETSQAGNNDPKEEKPEGFPPPYPTAKFDEPQLLSELKEVVLKAETAESVFNGKETLIPLGSEEKDGFRLIDPEYAKDIDSLTTRMYEGFKYTYWEDAYGKEVENMLPDVIKETENGVMMKYDQKENVASMEIDSGVITFHKDIYADVTVLGKKGEDYIWRTYEMIDGIRGWVVYKHSDKVVTGEVAVFHKLLIDNMETLSKIFGNVTPVKDGNDWNVQQIAIENDKYGNGFYNCLEIEPFMTVEEMRQYMRDSFTSEIAESYISLYINRTYIEKEGKLYIVNGSILPQTADFSLENYTNLSIGTYDVTSQVEWSDGENTHIVPITITYEDGLWKLDTRLPMKEDRIIGK